jgi:hypothetical protein
MWQMAEQLRREGIDVWVAGMASRPRLMFRRFRREPPGRRSAHTPQHRRCGPRLPGRGFGELTCFVLPRGLAGDLDPRVFCP